MKEAKKTANQESVVCLPELPAADKDGNINGESLGQWYDTLRRGMQDAFWRVQWRLQEQERQQAEAQASVVTSGAVKPGRYRFVEYKDGKGWEYQYAEKSLNQTETVWLPLPIHPRPAGVWFSITEAGIIS